MVGIYVTGASGCGSTTLGQQLAANLRIKHLDTDDFFWRDVDPPFTHAWEPEKRHQLLAQAISREASWILSGSIDHWGEPLTPLFDLVIFLSVATEMRLARLQAREADRFGARIEPGNDHHEVHQLFMSWAGKYEQGPRIGRSRTRHEAWLSKLICPVLRLEGSRSLDKLREECLSAVRQFGLAID